MVIDSPQHSVGVQVNVNTSTSPPSYTVTCSPPIVKALSGSMIITFILLTDGFRFRRNKAIYVERGGPGTQFPFDSWTQTDTIASIFDYNTDNGLYKYTICLIDDSNNEIILKDPAIQNTQ